MNWSSGELGWHIQTRSHTALPATPWTRGRFGSGQNLRPKRSCHGKGSLVEFLGLVLRDTKPCPDLRECQMVPVPKDVDCVHTSWRANPLFLPQLWRVRC